VRSTPSRSTPAIEAAYILTMLYFLGGFGILCGLMLLGWVFVNTSPARLARVLKWTGIVLTGAAVLALAVSGRLAMLLGIAAALIPLLYRLRSTIGGLRGPAVGNSSTVETPFVRMSLDHDTGGMTGTVLQGRFAGMRLDELSRAELLALLRECRTIDEEGARLVEAYLDRTDPDWRADLYGAQTGGSAGPRPSPSDVTVDEAYAMLGLQPGADAEAIKQLHPDHGGSDYFAAKLNRARDVLLRR
jgi:hypothetical protein